MPKSFAGIREKKQTHTVRDTSRTGIPQKHIEITQKHRKRHRITERSAETHNNTTQTRRKTMTLHRITQKKDESHQHTTAIRRNSPKHSEIYINRSVTQTNSTKTPKNTKGTDRRKNA